MKRRVNSIDRKVKYYSKKVIKYIYITIILTFILLVLGYLKFKPVFTVKLNGQEIGLVDNNVKVSSELEQYLKEPVAPDAVAHIEQKPEFELKFVSKNVDTNETEVKEKIDEKIEKTYRLYEIKVGEDVVGSVEKEEDAKKIADEIKADRGYNEITYHEQLSKENTIKSYEEVKKLAYDNVVSVQSGERKVAEAKREAEERRLREVAIASVSSRGGSVRTSVSASAAQTLSGMSFRTPIDSARFGVGFYGYAGHTGQDILSNSSNVKASASGIVTTVKDLGNHSYGRYIVIDHGNGISTLYGHCSSLLVNIGQKVEAGQIIGIKGSTGNSTGPHVHFEIRVNGRAINPRPYIS